MGVEVGRAGKPTRKRCPWLGSRGPGSLGASGREVRVSGCPTGGWANATGSRTLFFPDVDCDAAAEEAGGWSLNLSVLLCGK